MKRGRAALGALALAGLAGCGLFGRATSDYVPDGARREEWTQVQAEEVREVHRLVALGDLETARAWLARLRQRAPDNLGLAFLHQDVEIAAGREAQVREAARRLAEAEPDAAHLLAAARVEDDPAAARAWIDRALELDPGEAWVHYALAHREAREGDWVEAGRRLERALALDPGHIPARRLETMVLARGAERDEAIEALVRWLHNAPRDPLVSARELDSARLDLAQLLILDEEAEEARAVLAQLEEPERAGARVELVFAAVEQAQGRPVRALDAARAAGDQDGQATLSAVQEALLQEDWLGDRAAARAAWERVLARSNEGSDLSSVLSGLRARAALERLGTRQ
jgi:tetratricopeptide (TPR) repeat protein